MRSWNTRRIGLFVATVWLLACHLGTAQAGGGFATEPVFYYFDKNQFLAETGAINLSGPLPNGPGSAATQTVGLVRFDAHPPSTLNFSNWSAGLPGQFELALNGDEELNIRPVSGVLALGFEIEQAGRNHPNVGSTLVLDSVFEVTLCALQFDAGSDCPPFAVIARRAFVPPDSEPPEYSPGFFGVWANVSIAQIGIRETSFADGNEFFGEVFGGTEARAEPVLDQFENDNSPASASALALSAAGSDLPRPYVQDHTFHGDGDVDWIFYDNGNDRDFLLRVTSNDPGFHPLVEAYGPSRLTSPTVAPVVVYGDCAGPAGNLDIADSLIDFSLLKVRNCQDTGAPVHYELEYVVTAAQSFGNQQLAFVSGTVSLAGSGAPASAYIFSDQGTTSFSNPLTGNYRMVLTAGVETTLTVVAPDLTALPVPIPALFQGQTFQRNITVFSLGQMFADGFE